MAFSSIVGAYSGSERYLWTISPFSCRYRKLPNFRVADKPSIWICKPCAVSRYEPGLLAKLASIYMHEYGSDNLVKGGSGIDLVIR